MGRRGRIFAILAAIATLARSYFPTNSVPIACTHGKLVVVNFSSLTFVHTPATPLVFSFGIRGAVQPFSVEVAAGVVAASSLEPTPAGGRFRSAVGGTGHDARARVLRGGLCAVRWRRGGLHDELGGPRRDGAPGARDGPADGGSAGGQRGQVCRGGGGVAAHGDRRRCRHYCARRCHDGGIGGEQCAHGGRLAGGHIRGASRRQALDSACGLHSPPPRGFGRASVRHGIRHGPRAQARGGTSSW